MQWYHRMLQQDSGPRYCRQSLIRGMNGRLTMCTSGRDGSVGTSCASVTAASTSKDASVVVSSILLTVSLPPRSCVLGVGIEVGTLGSLIVVADVKTKNLWVNAAVTPDQESTKDWLGEDIENAVENGLGIGRNDISTLRKSPSDGVEEPEEHGPSAADHVRLSDSVVDAIGVASTHEEDIVGDEEQGHGREDKVTPLVRRGDQSTDETSDDHHFIDEKGVEDSWPWQTRRQEDI